MADYAKMIKELEDGLNNGQFTTDAQKKTAQDMIKSFQSKQSTSTPTPAPITIPKPATSSGSNSSSANSSTSKPVLLGTMNYTSPFAGGSSGNTSQNTSQKTTQDTTQKPAQSYLSNPLETALQKTPQQIQSGVKEVSQNINQFVSNPSKETENVSTSNTPKLISTSNVTLPQYAGATKYAPEKTQVTMPAPANNYDALYAQLQKQIQDAMNQPSQSYEELYRSIMDQLPDDVKPQVLSWEDALEQAKQNVNPLYDETQKKLGKALDINNLRSGFYGQKPGDAYKSERLAEEENARVQAINSLATQLQGLSKQDAQNIMNNNLAKQQQALQALNAAMSSSQTQKNQQLQNLWNLVNLARSDRSEAKADQRYEDERATDEQRYNDSLTWKQNEWNRDETRYQDTQNKYQKETTENQRRYDQEWEANKPIREAQLAGYQINNRINQLKLDNLPKQIQAEMQKLQNDLSNAKTQSEYDSILNDLNLAIKAAEKETAIQKLEDAYKTSPDSKGMNYSDYLNYLIKMANESVTTTQFDEMTGAAYTTAIPKYTWEDLKDVIQSLNVNSTWKNSLLNDTGTAVMYRNSKKSNQ